MVDLRLWGKARSLPGPYPVVWHLADVAAVAVVVWDRVLSVGQRRAIAGGLGVSEARARRLVGWWAGLHDVGKATAGFQAMHEASFAALLADGGYAAAPAGDGVRHERAAQLVLPALLETVGFSVAPWTLGTAYRCAQIVGAHHGRFAFTSGRDCRQASTSPAAELGGGRWQAERVALFEVMFEAFDRPQPPERISVEAAVLVTAVVVVADWLASQESFLAGRQATAATQVSAATVSAQLAGTTALAPGLLADAGLGSVGFRSEPFERVFGFAPNPLQRSVLEGLDGRTRGAGLLVVTAAPGDGKTEAALTAARVLGEAAGADGVYFALPTMATADQMYGRVGEFARRCVDAPASLAVLHSMAWLGREDIERQLAVSADAVVSDDPDLLAGHRVSGTDWLYGRYRGLLANLAVGTIDQALLAVLRAKYSMLRMLGLSSKVFVVDEAHAYDPYMQKLLECLLVWLGRLGSPVVLLSATLPSSVARQLIEAYGRGSGRTVPSDVHLRYPGWVFVPADGSHDVLEISDHNRAEVMRHRTSSLAVEPRGVCTGPAIGAAEESGTRGGVLREVLAGVVSEGGCAAVVCNTVRDAQDTYRELAAWLQDIGSAAGLRLLHARMPAWMRQQRTDELVARCGRDGSRTTGIVVATQVIEQSLDLDFDIMISDLAPMALLLQRAGRCWRHPIPCRPSWSHGPRLVVLDPVDASGGFVTPKRWGGVYRPFLLRATHHALVNLAGMPVRIPDDVQGLVEAVHEQGLSGVPGLAGDPAAIADYEDLRADESVLRGAAGMGVVPEPDKITDLRSLHEEPVTEAEIATRFGAESVKVIACFDDSDGGRWLDDSHTVPFPTHGSRPKGRFTDDEVRAVLRHSIPLRADYLSGAGPDQAPPPAWQDNVWLREIRLLPHTVSAAGIAEAAADRHRFRLDADLGLVIL